MILLEEIWLLHENQLPSAAPAELVRGKRWHPVTRNRQVPAVLSVLCCACNFADVPCGKKVIAFIQEILLIPTSSFSLRLRVWIHQNGSSFGCTWFVSLMCLLMRWGQPLLQGAQWSRSGQPAQAGTRKTPARCSENHLHHRSAEIREQVAQEACGVCILEDTRSSPGRGPKQPALAGCALSRGVSKWPPGIPSGVNYPAVLRSACKVQLLEYVVYYMSRKSVVLVKVLLCGREGSTNHLCHCTGFLFRALLEVRGLKNPSMLRGMSSLSREHLEYLPCVLRKRTILFYG